MQTKTTTTLEIPVKDKSYAPLAWVCKSVSKDSEREVLHAIEITHDEENDLLTIVGTDGHRLHKVEFPLHIHAGFIPAGQYVPRVTAKQVTLAKRENQNFPNWKQVIPDYSAPTIETVRGTYHASEKFGTLVSGLVARLNRNEMELIYNDQYLFDILGGKTLVRGKHGGQTWKFVAVDKSPLVLTSEHEGAGLYALVMPVRVTC